MSKKIISSHIFVFPFRWDVVKDISCLDTCINNRLSVEKFIKYLNINDKWEEEFCTSKVIYNDLDYNTYTYFYENVRKAIYGKTTCIRKNKCHNIKIGNSTYYTGKLFNKELPNRIVRCLNYKDIDDNSTYEIYMCKKNDDGKIIVDKIKEPYKLKIRCIKLKVYDTGIATLSYFLDNDKYKGEDILRINDYGRRIYPQYIPLQEVKNSFLAKKLSIKLKNRVIEEEFCYEVKNKPHKISNTIMDILGERFTSIDSELENKCLTKEENIFVRPVIDDRMFVICYYNSDFWSRVLTSYNKDEYLKNDFWYQFLFVDNGGATCQDEKMKKELLKESTYIRWKDYGTLFGISRYSFVIICDESKFSKSLLYNHINTIYYEMILLALVQRASILRFLDETSRVSSVNLKSESIYKQIKNLQEYYIRFINTIYFREVTAQEQGIELYDKLVEFMRIDREVKRLDDEINEIQRYLTLKTNEKTNKLLNLVTFIGLAISAMSLITSTLNVLGKTEHLIMRQFVALLIIVFIIKIIKKVIN